MKFIPVTEEEKREMLERIGLSIDDILSQIPEDIKFKGGLRLPPPLSEYEIWREMRRISEENASFDRFTCFIGGGAYDHFIPSVVNHIISRPEFYTAYTPYQAEVSQGTLQAIYEYQSMICELTSMDVSNASMYDGATALTEGILMGGRINGKRRLLIFETIHPYYRKVIETYLSNTEFEIEYIHEENGRGSLDELKGKISSDVSSVVVQHPNFFGILEDVEEIEKIAHGNDALFIVSFDPISLGVLKPPGDYNADIATGEGQCLGIPPSFGGPFLGIFTAKRDFIRQMPGRIIGKTLDREKRRGFVMTLQTREQHIRRERATSNICTNEGLCALASCVYMALMGKNGMEEVAYQTTQKAHYLASRLKEEGFILPYTSPFFKEFVVEFEKPSKEIVDMVVKKGILPGVDMGIFKKEWEKRLLIAVTEKRTKEEMEGLIDALKKA